MSTNESEPFNFNIVELFLAKIWVHECLWVEKQRFIPDLWFKLLGWHFQQRKKYKEIFLRLVLLSRVQSVHNHSTCQPYLKESKAQSGRLIKNPYYAVVFSKRIFFYGLHCGASFIYWTNSRCLLETAVLGSHWALFSMSENGFFFLISLHIISWNFKLLGTMVNRHLQDFAV